MEKTERIYWTSTVILAGSIFFIGLVQAFHRQAEVDLITNLGFPVYFLTILGSWEILGSIILVIPVKPAVKEWAYAGIFFVLSGAILAHVAAGDPLTATIPALSLILLTVISWLFRPKAAPIN
ncbi:MAG TPA: DoxX family protein [Acidobacteriota bacterium]|nr:DoxX family protein [Acidobacteriota bacterium]